MPLVFSIILWLALSIAPILALRERRSRWTDHPLSVRRDAPPSDELRPTAEVALASFENYTQAGMAASHLEAEGIHSLLIPLGGLRARASFLGPYELHVLARDAGRAWRILDRRRRVDAGIGDIKLYTGTSAGQQGAKANPEPTSP